MKKFLLLLILVSWNFPAYAADSVKETTYGRVQRTGTIRCGYMIWPPFMDKDVKTGKFSGVDYDYFNAVAQSLGLKVDWAVEVVNGLQVEALRTGKIDAICTAEGPLVPSTARFVYYSDPIAYFPFFFYARPDDKRFDNNLAAVNQPGIKIAVVDGDVSTEVAAAQYARATRYAMAQSASSTQMMMDVASHKADLVIVDTLTMAGYLKANPGTLHRVPSKPVAVIPNTFSVMQGPGSLDLLTLINQGMRNLQNFGTDTLILDRYAGGVEQIYRVEKPYVSSH